MSTFYFFFQICWKQKDVTVSWFIMLAIMANSYAAHIMGVFPTASISHQQPMLALSYELASRGHHLTVLTTNPSEVCEENIYFFIVYRVY